MGHEQKIGSAIRTKPHEILWEKCVQRSWYIQVYLMKHNLEAWILGWYTFADAIHT